MYLIGDFICGGIFWFEYWVKYLIGFEICWMYNFILFVIFIIWIVGLIIFFLGFVESCMVKIWLWLKFILKL